MKDSQSSRQPKPGDRFFRPRRVKRFRLKRVLGVAALFSAGYGDVGSSIYYALGIVALVALGATPIVLGIAGVIYIFNALSYAEGGAMIPEGGGSAAYARLGFNDLFGFIAGWALMLSYIVTMAISAYTIPPYLAYFWPALKEPFAGTIASIGIILFLMLVNVLGVRESARLNILFIGVDIATQLGLVVMGFILLLLPNPTVLSEHMFGAGNWPSTQNLIFGIALAALCFTGVETVSQLADETRQPQRRIPQAYILMTIVVLVLFAGISLVALTAMEPQELANRWARDPVAGIANSISTVMAPEEMAAKITTEPALAIVLSWIFNGIRNALPVLVAGLAASILLTATNAGLLGISRLTYNLSSHRQLPATLSRVHHLFRTPYLAISLFSLIAILLLIPGFFSPQFFTDLGALYVFGSLLTFAMAHAAILALRVRQPDLPRPFKLSLNIKIKGRELPLTAMLGLISTFVIWLIIIVIQPNSRWAGLAWMAVGLVVYTLYQRRRRKTAAASANKPVSTD
ncbi:MAG: APC family permease [Chloroflexi bacterium]|nr:APC family permease [Chloroflexota bacterium]